MSVTLTFIISFGVVKAFANLVSGQLADVWGRKRVLVLGWLVAVLIRLGTGSATVATITAASASRNSSRRSARTVLSRPA